MQMQLSFSDDWKKQDKLILELHNCTDCKICLYFGGEISIVLVGVFLGQCKELTALKTTSNRIYCYESNISYPCYLSPFS